MSSKLKSYSVNAIGDLLPLDRESCEEVINYAVSLRTEAEIQTYFMNLLGETTDAFTFIGNFIRMKEDEEKPLRPRKNPENVDITLKPQKVDKVWGGAGQTSSDSQRSKNYSTSKVSSKTSTTTSQLFDNKKAPVAAPMPTSAKAKKRNLDNLKDIESVLNELEIKAEQSDTRRYCNCMATRHPLFEIAPNCLNCGKIICSKEGLQPCSYCGSELLTAKDRVDIMNVLKQEKNELLNKQDKIRTTESSSPQPKVKAKKIVVTLNAGENLWKAQDRALKQAEAERKKAQQKYEDDKVKDEEIAIENLEIERSKVNPDLLKAQERLETLLTFQDTSAERTKIIDNAADYELPSISSGNMWLSPVERALQLKKKQKQMRKQEDTVNSRTGRGEKSVEMVIKDGKVTMVEKHRVPKATEGEDSEISKLEEELRSTKQSSERDMSRNIWDFESDKNKWAKPVYTGTSDSTHDEGETFSQPVLKPRVQFSELEGVDGIVAIP
ncbi:putative zinc finger motif, C2HC5-type-domain-containing protein [Scheffersomyces xylosifermentans]|uniref:putative zinc finger motif, C2HC5-type-domain-containing protein n=1 Tax=Scheffersomyces xylosifermentans TaxID=1304137 RepID=UPI00315CD0A7